MKNVDGLFKVLRCRVHTLMDFSAQQTASSEAVVTVEVEGKSFMEAADADGPVHAIDKALRKVLLRFFPEIAEVKLTNYEVPKSSTKRRAGSPVKVIVTSSDGKKSWVTTGFSTNILRASLVAIMKSLEKELQHRVS